MTQGKKHITQAVKEIKFEIAANNLSTNRQLIELCKKRYITLIDVKGDSQRIHEVLETAVNLHWFEKAIGAVEKDQYKTLVRIEELTQKLPTQSWRDGEQTDFQQFSTPPALAFVMSQLLKPAKNSTALEPSAGTGCLADWLKIAGYRVEVNEISARRRHLLEIQGYAPHNINAEFLDDLLDTEIKPDFILMNPPFSASGGRTDRRNTDFGFRHVESALLRLNPGGRLVCLLGANGCLKTDKGKSFWDRIGREHKVHCFLVVPPKAFYKHGTTYQTVIAVVDKPPPAQTANHRNDDKTKIIEFCSLKEILQFSEESHSTNC